MSTTPRSRKKKKPKKHKRKSSTRSLQRSSSRKKGAAFSPKKAALDPKYVDICKNLLSQITKLEESRPFHDVLKSDHKLFKQYKKLIPNPMSFSLVSISFSLSLSALRIAYSQSDRTVNGYGYCIQHETPRNVF